ncbi:hypothetical protein V9T20_02020 [Halobacterium salinarum]|uniref:hypothetical protein n=1 Tax=Halobacterium salinarum TaxID=2242 RepID=UPI0030D33F4B
MDNEEMTDDGIPEFDLFQRRLREKSSRAIRVIQFDLIGLSIVGAIPQLSDSGNLEPNVYIYVGSIPLLLSFVLAIIAISIGSVPLAGLVRNSNQSDRQTALVADYRNRIKEISLIPAAALGNGATGIAILLIGVIDATSGVVPLFKGRLRIIFICAFIFLCGGGFILGQFLAGTLPRQD